ncbi:cytochrome P450 [Massariosphaeria phaeospora]|uniref:Cytochrome P450 n=1 Tax=Massariosphaeria phaeospora TaxID=100035 RepID=A0A7C8I652_9PLEO|nr:cytochrome P450 [Massariosphaeria phaeospora]
MSPTSIWSTVRDNAQIAPGHVGVLFCIGLSFCLLSNWVFRVIAFHGQSRRKGVYWEPPTLPYAVPIWGNTTSFILTPLSFMERAGAYCGTYITVRVRLLFGTVYVVRGKNNISSLWKESVNSNYTELLGFMLDRMFDMPAKALTLWKDDSGFLHKPHAQSSTAPHNRVDHITHELAHDFLLSPRSKEIPERYSTLLQKQLTELDIGTQWLEMDDLMEFFQQQMTAANMEAMYGPTLRAHMPTLCDDFWLFNRHIGPFCKQFPKWTIPWTIPAACKARSNILQAIKHWQSHMRDRADSHATSDLGSPDCAYWGPEQVRKWQDKLRAMDGFDDDAIASLYFGIIWVSNVNIVPSAFWIALELYRDPSLLTEARSSVERCVSIDETKESGNQASLKHLTKDTLLQSVFAETLRLRTHAYITRYFSHKYIVLGDRWVIPQKKLCLLSTHPAQHDESVWNTYNGKFPLDTFWSRRFIIDPEDPSSGPVRPDINDDKIKPRRIRSDSVTGAGTGPAFSLEGLAASWIPFGGGPRACPGRHVAKQQVLATISSIIMQFDIEVVAGQEAWRMDESGYGPGVQSPVGKIPFRIRRRVPG